MKSKYSNYKIFQSEEEVKTFLENYYESFMKQIPPYEAGLITMTQASQLFCNDFRYDLFLEAFRRIEKKLPKTPFDLVLFRGDDSNYYSNKNRPFLAHSFLEDTAKGFTAENKLYKIYVPKDSMIFPTCGINGSGFFSEQEVLLETSKLEKVSEYSFRYNNK